MKRWIKILVRCFVVIVLLGSVWTVISYPGRPFFGQDLETLYTLRQLRAVYPEVKEVNIQYEDDGWVLFDVVLPEELEIRRIARQNELRSECRDFLANGELPAGRPETSVSD